MPGGSAAYAGPSIPLYRARLIETDVNMDRETVARVARTAHLELTEEELDRFSRDLGEILDWFKVLDEAPGHDGIGVNPTEVQDVLRDDQPSQEFPQDVLLRDMRTYDLQVRGPKLV